MKKSQLTHIGIPLDTWTTLENNVCCIQLSNDGHLFPSPEGKQFFFDSSTELLFVRNTIPAGFISGEKVEVNIKNVLVKLSILPGGYVDEKNNLIGHYHEVYNFESITSIQ